MPLTHVHLIDLVSTGCGLGHAERVAGLLVADGLTVTLHGRAAEASTPGVTPCPCVAGSRRALLGHLRRAVAGGSVAHVHGPTADDGTALAVLGLLRHAGRHVSYSPHGALAAASPVADVLLRRRLLLADAVIADGQEQAAALGSLGAEAWASPLVLAPETAAIAAWRATWEADAGTQVVLAIGPADLAAHLRDLPVNRRLAVVLATSAAAWTAAVPAAQVTAEPLDEHALAAAIAAADAVVIPAGHVAGTRAADVAGQLGTPVLVAGGAETASLAGALDRVLAAGTPPAVDPPDAARTHRLAYGEAVAPAASMPTASGRPRVSVIAWTNAVGRTAEMATAFDGEGRLFYDLNITSRRLIPLRYALSALRTAAYLARRRPEAVIVANPPIVPPLIALAYHRLTGAPLILDSQTSSFGQKSSRLGKLTLPLSAWVSRRSTCTLVGAEELGARVEEWGANAEVFHEAPPLWRAGAPSPVGRHPRVLWIGVFASDEPLDALLAAAAQLPDVEFRVAGDLRRAPAGRKTAPPNVTWLGFVRGRAYPQEVQDADLVITMTTDPTSALRGAAEAVFAERPLITTDWPFLRDLFPSALFVPNDSDGIASGVRRALEDLPELQERARAGRIEHLRRWEAQLARLRFWLGEPTKPQATESVSA